MKSERIQLSPGVLKETVEQVELFPLAIERRRYSVGVTLTIAGAPREVTLAYLARQCGPARLNGELWIGRRVAILFGNAEFASNEPASLVLVRVPMQNVPILKEAIEAGAWTTDSFAFLEAGDPIARSLRAAVESVLVPERAHAEDAPALKRRLVALIVRAAETAAAGMRHRRRSTREAVVEAARAYVWAHINEEIGLQDICKGIGCGSRTLINYFQALYGISPIRFIRLARLNRVREVLRAGLARSTMIFDVAADYGFWHMGHFTANYRALFGETPSETLTGAA